MRSNHSVAFGPRALYDGLGNVERVTSYDGTGDGTLVNEVYREFNGLGQLTADYQSHFGGVNTSTTPAVQYAYSEMPSGADHSRLTSITYPDGYVFPPRLHSTVFHKWLWKLHKSRHFHATDVDPRKASGYSPNTRKRSRSERFRGCFRCAS